MAPLPYRVTDVHVHIQPWRDMKPSVQEAMRNGKEAHWDFLLSMMDDPKVLLDIMDRSGVWRVGMVNYVSPDVMAFTTVEVNGRRIRPRVLGGGGAAVVMVQVEAADEVSRLSDAFLRR